MQGGLLDADPIRDKKVSLGPDHEQIGLLPNFFIDRDWGIAQYQHIEGDEPALAVPGADGRKPSDPKGAFGLRRATPSGLGVRFLRD